MFLSTGCVEFFTEPARAFAILDTHRGDVLVVTGNRSTLRPSIGRTLRRTVRVEKLARIYDDEIAPCWGMPFGKLLLRNLAVPARGQVLDVSCGTGNPTIEILRRMSDDSRLIAIDESSAMLDVVRRKVAELGSLGKKGVFFRTESALPRLSFADDVYDLVVCNLGLPDMPCIAGALQDFARVAKPGGEVRCTLPLAGTFEEFHDLYREVLVKHDRHDALERLRRHVASYPSAEDLERRLADAGLRGRVEIEEFTLLFRSSREFFYAPVIEYGPLAGWKAVAGGGQDMQDVFWFIKEAIDAYFDGGPFQLTVKAGCLIGHKPERVRGARADELDADPADGIITTPIPLTATFDTEDDSGFDDLETGLPWPPTGIAEGSVRVAPDDPAMSEPLSPGEHALDEDSPAEQELDAFIDGKKRPHHLAD
jgi:ubiquinone/menaquinone biosynthesis C-methylase UbiE